MSHTRNAQRKTWTTAVLVRPTVNHGHPGLKQLQGKLTGSRCRYWSRERASEVARRIIEQSGAGRWVTFEIEQRAEPPSARRAGDARSDRMFPLITNTTSISKARILEAYNSQPRLEKRHEQLKSVDKQVAPVFLKRVSRIEALLFVCFLCTGVCP